MTFQQETSRLYLRVLTPDFAPSVLSFYEKNRGVFEPFEPISPDTFYTLEHQQRLLTYEYQETLLLHILRFWLFDKSDPDTIVGSVCFRNISPDIFSCAQVGYKIDAAHWNKGFCTEALDASLSFVSREIGIRRFEALVLPDNDTSIHLLEKMGFEKEGLLKEKIYLQDQWKDHFLYSLLLR